VARQRCRPPESDVRARDVHERMANVGRPPRQPRPQPGARLAGEPARLVRRERHSRDRRHGDPVFQVGDFCRQRRRAASCGRRGGHVAGRTLPLDACRRSFRRGPLLRRGGQPRRLSRHRVLAGRCAVARMAVLCGCRFQPAKRMVGRLRRAERVRGADAIVSAVGSGGSRCSALLPVLRRGGEPRQRAPHALRRRQPENGRLGIRSRSRDAPVPRLHVRLHFGSPVAGRPYRQRSAAHERRRGIPRSRAAGEPLHAARNARTRRRSGPARRDHRPRRRRAGGCRRPRVTRSPAGAFPADDRSAEGHDRQRITRPDSRGSVRRRP